MLTPRYRLSLGKTTLDSKEQPKTASVVQLIVSVNMEAAVDSLVITLGQIGGSVKPALNDKVSLALGYEDGNLEQVFTGTVFTLEPSLLANQITAYTAGLTLLNSYLDQTYEKQTAGAIVRDLARKAKVPVGSVEDGSLFPYYVIDDRRNFSRHARDLADLCGFDSYFNPEGSLLFKNSDPTGTPHKLEYRKDILELWLLRNPAIFRAVQAWGESPTDTRGSGSSAWLTKNFGRSKGTAGSGKPVALLERPALRTNEAAKRAAIAEETRIQRNTIRGRLVTVGQPQIQLGDAIQISGVPDSNLNHPLQVRSLTHHLSKRDGFTTEIGFRAIKGA